MPSALDLTNKKIGYLTFIKKVGVANGGCILWECLCDCGNTTIVRGYQVKSGHTRSCGCYNKELVTKHSLWNHPLYRTHRHILHRCYNPKNKSYKNYGARGIALYTPWHDVVVFIGDILTSIGDRPNSIELDRIDNNGNYEPGNVRWANRKTQSKNRSNNIWVNWQGKNRLLCELAEERGIRLGTMYTRLYKLNWPLKRALTERVNK